MTERDVLTVARQLALLVEDANATLHRLAELKCLTDEGMAIVIAWQERAAGELRRAGELL
jgi:hypothetical protein